MTWLLVCLQFAKVVLFNIVLCFPLPAHFLLYFNVFFALFFLILSRFFRTTRLLVVRSVCKIE